MIHFISDDVVAYIRIKANVPKSTWRYAMTAVWVGLFR